VLAAPPQGTPVDGWAKAARWSVRRVLHQQGKEAECIEAMREVGREFFGCVRDNTPEQMPTPRRACPISMRSAMGRNKI
jgi:hypothetical protein